MAKVENSGEPSGYEFTLLNLHVGNLIAHSQPGSKATYEVVVDASDLLWLERDPAHFNKQHSPIPISVELLTRAGAINSHGQTFMLHKLKLDFNSEGVMRFHWSGKVTYLDYWHELQNLYRALKCAELTLREVVNESST